MKDIEFLEKEFSFISELKSSSSYLKMKELSHNIDNDQELIFLSNKRDNYISLADKEKDPFKKRELLIEFNKTDEELREHPLMKEYLFLYQEFRHLLNNLANALTKEIRS